MSHAHLCICIICIPWRPQGLLSSNIPHQEMSVVDHNLLHVAADRRGGVNHLVHRAATYLWYLALYVVATEMYRSSPLTTDKEWWSCRHCPGPQLWLCALKHKKERAKPEMNKCFWQCETNSATQSIWKISFNVQCQRTAPLFPIFLQCQLVQRLMWLRRCESEQLGAKRELLQPQISGAKQEVSDMNQSGFRSSAGNSLFISQIQNCFHSRSAGGLLLLLLFTVSYKYICEFGNWRG